MIDIDIEGGDNYENEFDDNSDEDMEDLTYERAEAAK